MPDRNVRKDRNHPVSMTMERRGRREYAWAVVEGVEYAACARSGPLNALARLLVEAGVADRAWTATNAAHPGIVAMSGPSIRRLAMVECEHHPEHGLRTVPRKVPRIGAGASPKRPEHKGEARSRAHAQAASGGLPRRAA